VQISGVNELTLAPFRPGSIMKRNVTALNIDHDLENEASWRGASSAIGEMPLCFIKPISGIVLL